MGPVRYEGWAGCGWPDSPDSYDDSDDAFDVMQAAAQVQMIIALVIMAFILLRLLTPSSTAAQREWWQSSKASRERIIKWISAGLLPEDFKARQLADDRLIEFWRVAFRILSSILSISLFGLIIMSFADGSMAEMFTSPTANTVTAKLAQDGFSLHVYVLLWCYFFQLFPRMLTKCSIYVFIVMSYLRMHLQMAIPQSLPLLEHQCRMIVIFKVFLTMHCPGALMVLLLNVASSVAQVYLRHTAHRRSHPQSCDAWLMASEIEAFVAVMFAYCVFLYMLNKEIRSTLDAQALRNHQESSWTLLDSLCDAVVHLRSDLTLVQRSQKLDALLFRSSLSTPTPTQINFLDLLITDTDKDRFRHFMSNQGGKHSLHISMRDSMENPVKMQLYKTSYKDLWNEDYHIIGILEHFREDPGDSVSFEISSPRGDTRGRGAQPRSTSNDRLDSSKKAMNLTTALGKRHLVEPLGAGASGEGPTLPQSSGGVGPTLSGGSGGLGLGGQQEVLSGSPTKRLGRSAVAEVFSDTESMASSKSSEVDTAEELPIAPSEDYEDGEVALWIDTSNSGLPMLRCTPAFVSLFSKGSLRKGAKFTSWVYRKDRKAFKGELQDRLMVMLASGQPQTKAWHIILKPRGMASHDVETSIMMCAQGLNSNANGRSRTAAYMRNPTLKVTCLDTKVRSPHAKLVFEAGFAWLEEQDQLVQRSTSDISSASDSSMSLGDKSSSLTSLKSLEMNQIIQRRAQMKDEIKPDGRASLEHAQFLAHTQETNITIQTAPNARPQDAREQTSVANRYSTHLRMASATTKLQVAGTMAL